MSQQHELLATPIRVAAHIAMVIAMSNISNADAMKYDLVVKNDMVVEYVEAYGYVMTSIVTVVAVVVGMMMFGCSMRKYLPFSKTSARVSTSLLDTDDTQDAEINLRAQIAILEGQLQHNRREIHRLRTQVVRLRVGTCYCVPNGNRWHLFHDCPGFNQTKTPKQENKDVLCMCVGNCCNEIPRKYVNSI